jgi:anti-anti-sigma regulatory factor
MARFHLKTQTVGSDCMEVRLTGDADAAATARLDEMFDAALEEGRHLLMNLARCDHIDTAAVAAITAGRNRLGRAGLNVLPFAITGVLRPIVAGVFAREIQAEPMPELRRTP